MKNLLHYQTKYKLNNEEEIFNYFMNNLSETIKLWDYFVDWQKVKRNIRDLELDLNTLNYLIGKTNIESEFLYLIKKRPSIIQLIPILLACREKNIKILNILENNSISDSSFDFRQKDSYSSDELKTYCEFVKKTGLLNIFKNKIIKSIPDYVTGIEVGLDSNGRKNRTGKTMEDITEGYIKAFCNTNKEYSYISQATKRKILNKWNINVMEVNTKRKFDFAISNSKKLFLIETNFYGGEGSKLKATASEYTNLHKLLTEQGFNFVWITDGLGWQKTRNPLRDSYTTIDYIFNLKMLSDGIFTEVVNDAN